ncbi:lysophospholipase [Tardiphaga sp. vice352]|uniref:alpha/beta hydrolase n=1 Tax=unclassified Tardiphaga TaxID=2631404 RepID=UPI0011620444|nr:MULTISPECIES: alpha/beta fold hydrolase [unclassified Tardiphaga]MBC7582221.1 alpha/beta fold hydrolase [Tardiphaga sp.]QDM15449.1 lysophospholipase [Tardiphaga sp. vice278]QDM20491.1 lysophospholipase [Tardiphaga sp. vice154]QDM25613.1 lysophospholipase [Tardiphaga sp. vice304]QDM30832.1 lysophospholipase [Tardiphaga sp. vice352]
MRQSILVRGLVAVLAIGAIALAISQLRGAAQGLSITRTTVGSTPVTLFQPATPGIAPVVVIAHGFAGSQQLMQPFALTLARNGYLAVTFDFLGHGRNPQPMRGDITEGTGITAALLKELGEVATYARSLPGSDGRLAVLGHSMASDIVVRYAQATPDVQATVAVSVFSKVATATSPRNLLVIVGALEPSMLRDEGLRIVGLATDGTAVAGESYGSFSAGTARKLVLASGVEHIGVLYSGDSLQAASRWLDAAFDRAGSGFIDSRGVSLALLFAGLIALAWPLSALLPQVAAAPVGSSLGWKPLLLAALLPALLTPLLLWKAPTDFLSILLGDYLALHFLVYGALTAALLLWLRPRGPMAVAVSPRAIAIAALAVAAYNLLAFGLPMDAYVFSFAPIPARWPVMAAIALGALPYFIADEWLTRGASVRRGAYALTKFAFLLSLAIAILLNPMKLFFLAIIVPAILLLFFAFGLISRWCYYATNHPLPGALANAAIFSWAIAVTFPMVVS